MKSIAARLDIRPSFIFVSATMIALGYIEQFFMLLFAVVLHELTHVVAAALLHMRTEKITVTPLGLTALIRDLDSASVAKMTVVLLAGPLMSLLIYTVSARFSPAWRSVNLAIFLLNILPLHPFDGGKLLQQILGNRIGVIPGNRLLIAFSKSFALFLVLLGILQTILYPYNISLFCVGIYIWKNCGREHLHMTLFFYTSLMAKTTAQQNCYPVKAFIVRADCPINTVIHRFCRDYYHMVHVLIGEETAYTLTESQIVSYIMTHGLTGVVEDIHTEP